MAGKFEFKFDLDEDEETWLTPQLSTRLVGTQSKPIDLKEWFGQIQMSDRASLLSKKLQKYAQKRAARSERHRLSASSSLDVVAESPEADSHSDDQIRVKDSDLSAGTPAAASVAKNPSPIREGPNDSGVANKTAAEVETKVSTPSNSHSIATTITSTPLTTQSTGCNAPKAPILSPIPSSPPAVKPMPCSDSEEEFFDASSEFDENVKDLLMTRSLHEDQLNGIGMLPDDSGISVVRNCMTQSLMKVEEESPVSQLIVQSENTKPQRSSSVSPRPISSFTETARADPTIATQSKCSAESIDQSRTQSSNTVTPLSSRSRSSASKQQTRLTRPSSMARPQATTRTSHSVAATHTATKLQSTPCVQRVPNPKAQLLQALISTPTTTNKERGHNGSVVTTPDNANTRPYSAPRPSPQTQGDIPDLAALKEIARKQEEALRQAVEQQQHGNMERKHSWQNDLLSRSAHSSSGSLVSSKSVDMASLNRMNANVVASKIPAPTRVTRKTGIPAPARRVGISARCASAIPQHADDDECF